LNNNLPLPLDFVGILSVKKGHGGNITRACICIDPSTMEAAPDCELIGVGIDFGKFVFGTPHFNEVCAQFDEEGGVRDWLIIVTDRAEPGVMRLARPKDDFTFADHIASPVGLDLNRMAELPGAGNGSRQKGFAA